MRTRQSLDDEADTRNDARWRHRGHTGWLLCVTALVAVACAGDSGSATTVSSELSTSAPAASTTAASSLTTTESGTVATTLGTEAASSECPSLTAADVEAITGVSVVAVERGATAGSGGTCANYSTADGGGYVGVNVLSGADSYALSFPPEGAYLPPEELSGIGDEAAGFRLIESWPYSYVVARQGETVAVVFSLSQEITDAQIAEMAATALG